MFTEKILKINPQKAKKHLDSSVSNYAQDCVCGKVSGSSLNVKIFFLASKILYSIYSRHHHQLW